MISQWNETAKVRPQADGEYLVGFAVSTAPGRAIIRIAEWHNDTQKWEVGDCCPDYLEPDDFPYWQPLPELALPQE